MKDVQNMRDDRELAIDQVGVCDLRYPIEVLDRAHGKQPTVATLSLSVDLPQQFKGTHMSRFVEVLKAHREDMTMDTLPRILDDLQHRLHAERAHIEVRFPYFLERRAPVSGAASMLDYECWFLGSRDGEEDDFVLGLRAPVTSLCPCSREISDYGAHNQRGHLTLEVRMAPGEMIWIEELVELAEASASAPVYPLLKRPDERFVTMQAYDNPVFVEDMVRNAAARLQDDPRVAWFNVHAVNFESIHNHQAFARIERRISAE